MRKEVIGDCELYLADCLDVMPSLKNIDVVITDPPYGIGERNGTISKKRNRNAYDVYDDSPENWRKEIKPRIEYALDVRMGAGGGIHYKARSYNQWNQYALGISTCAYTWHDLSTGCQWYDFLGARNMPTDTFLRKRPARRKGYTTSSFSGNAGGKLPRSSLLKTYGFNEMVGVAWKHGR